MAVLMAHRILLELHTICLISSADQENYLEMVVALIIRTRVVKANCKAAGLHCLLIQLKQQSMVHLRKCCPVPSTSDDPCKYPHFYLGQVAQYPLHHVTYAPPKLEVATSNGLGVDAFTRKYII